MSESDLKRGASVYGGARRERREDFDYPKIVVVVEGVSEHRDENAAEAGRRERREGQEVRDSVDSVDLVDSGDLFVSQ